MNTRISLVIFSLFQASSLMAAELTPFVKENKLGAVVKEMKFPDSLSKDLVSGLSNKVLVRYELMVDSNVRAQKTVEITIKYDLWNENFRMNVAIGDSDVESKTLPSLKEAISFLENLKIANLWTTGDLPNTGLSSLKADVLLNPVEKEQMEKIKKWVTQNSVSTPLDPTGFSAAKPVAPSRANSLFNKIFEQYATGANVASAWKETVSSKPFRMKEVEHEK